MKTLLLCGYRSTTDFQEDPLGLTRGEDGLTLIDRRLEQLTTLGLEPICVLAGSTADEQLRVCRSIAEADLVFDTNAPHVSLTTNIKAGLAAAEGEPCLVLPVEIPCPTAEEVAFLQDGWAREGMNGPVSLVQILTPQGTPHHFGFPLLITRFGSAEIRRLPDLRSLVDTRLKYLHIVYPREANLASTAKPA